MFIEKIKPAFYKALEVTKEVALRDLLPAAVSAAFAALASFFLLFSPLIGAVSAGALVLANTLIGHLIENITSDVRLQRHLHIFSFVLPMTLLPYFSPLAGSLALTIGTTAIGTLLAYDLVLKVVLVKESAK